MIKGIGIDIVEIERIKDKINIFNKVLTIKEIEIFNSLNDLQRIEFLAGRFAAKEAYYKAKNDKSIGYLDIEVLNDEDGKPYSFAKESKSFLALSYATILPFSLTLLNNVK